MTVTKKSGKTATSTDESADGFTQTERDAIKERAQELRSAKRRGGKVADESAVLEKIAEMPEPDRGIAEHLHAVIKDSAPDLSAKLWYGQPAYAKDGKVVCFFQSAAKFKTRYGTLGFSEEANLDDGEMWSTAFAITTWTAAVEDRISELVKKAVS